LQFLKKCSTFYQTTQHHIPVGRNLQSGYIWEPHNHSSHMHTYTQHQCLLLLIPDSSLQALLNLSYFVFTVIYHKLRNQKSSL
jgi:hypothetical protein